MPQLNEVMKGRPLEVNKIISKDVAWSEASSYSNLLSSLTFINPYELTGFKTHLINFPNGSPICVMFERVILLLAISELC